MHIFKDQVPPTPVKAVESDESTTRTRHRQIRALPSDCSSALKTTSQTQPSSPATTRSFPAAAVQFIPGPCILLPCPPVAKHDVVCVVAGRRLRGVVAAFADFAGPAVQFEFVVRVHSIMRGERRRFWNSLARLSRGSRGPECGLRLESILAGQEGHVVGWKSSRRLRNPLGVAG